MKFMRKHCPRYLFGITLVALSQILAYSSSWLLFNEVEPPKSLLK
ncbi:hypothetical protein [Clostridium sp. 'deep sea']|nr:hypothetical protein [Clostridium sp. 'deep sea']